MIKQISIIVLVFGTLFVSCKTNTTENKKTDTDFKKGVVAKNIQSVNLSISGMTCEIGCAKTIESKLSKRVGVANAKVIFKDSIATVQFDANITNKEELITFVNSIAGGSMYAAKETK